MSSLRAAGRVVSLLLAAVHIPIVQTTSVFVAAIVAVEKINLVIDQTASEVVAGLAIEIWQMIVALVASTVALVASIVGLVVWIVALVALIVALVASIVALVVSIVALVASIAALVAMIYSAKTILNLAFLFWLDFLFLFRKITPLEKLVSLVLICVPRSVSSYPV